MKRLKGIKFENPKGKTWARLTVAVRTICFTLIALILHSTPYSLLPTPHSTLAFAAQNEWVVFDSKVDGHWQIYLSDVDTGETMHLTGAGSDNQDPVWSPDGTRIAFVSKRDGNAEIYVLDVTGLSSLSTQNLPLTPHNLTQHSGHDFTPVWSSDGSRIAFVSDRDGNQEIYTVNADGTGVSRMTENHERDYSPNWSPDGSRLAFVSRRDGNYEIYTMKADGTDQQNLTKHSAEDGRGDHSWSPDGKRIAWITDRDMNGDGNWEIYVMSAQGLEVRNLTQTRVEERMGMAIWSPDGRKIAFTSFRDGNSEIYIMDEDGKNQQGLTEHPSMDRDPVWSSNGRRIAFVSNRGGEEALYVILADGTGLKKITSAPAVNGTIHWRPARTVVSRER